MSLLTEQPLTELDKKVYAALGEKVDGLSAREGAERALAAVRRLRSECEVEEPLSSHGMSEEAVQTCAERVFSQHAPRSIGGPRGFRSLEEVLTVLRAAY